MNAVDDDTVEISDTSGNLVRVVFNPETGMPVRMFYESVPAAGPPVAVNETFTEFKEVAGIQFPHSFTLFQGGQKFADVEDSDLKVNKGFKPEDSKNGHETGYRVGCWPCFAAGAGGPRKPRRSAGSVS